MSAPYTIYIRFMSPLQTPKTRVRGGLMTLSMMPYSRASDVSKYLLRLKSCWICAARPRVRPPSQDPPCWPTLAGNRHGREELKTGQQVRTLSAGEHQDVVMRCLMAMYSRMMIITEPHEFTASCRPAYV